MGRGIYATVLASVTLALAWLWLLQPGWRGLELFALFALVSPLFAPLAYRLAVWIWVAGQRRRLGLPAASDRDLIDFVGEELDRAAIDWHWRIGWRNATRGDEIEIGADEDDDLTVRARHGILMVGTTAAGTSRFVDPTAAVDYAISLYDGPARADAGIFEGIPEDEA